MHDTVAWGFWRANGSRLGRLTIPITPILPATANRTVIEDSRRRGGWDYIPDDSNDPSKHLETPEPGSEGTHGVFNGSAWHSDQFTRHRKSSLRTPHPLSQPTREFGSRSRHTGRPSTYALSVAASSFASKFAPHIKTFKNLLRNEVRAVSPVTRRMNNALLMHRDDYLQLVSTSAVTLLQGATSILAVLNVNSESSFPVYFLSMISWVVISQLLLFTFDRVIRRHEKEAMSQNSRVWEPAHREVREGFRVPTTRESSPLGANHPAFPDNLTHRSTMAASSIVSDPFRSRRSSWSSGVHSRPYAERELSPGLAPMHGRLTPGTTPSTLSSYPHLPSCLASSLVHSSPRSTIASSAHILPRQSGGSG